jgi:hypothetical protein
MPILGTCKLCQCENVALQASHIVPEFFYKRIYTKKHKFTAVASDSDERLAIEQKGYRESLLCQSCETKLSKWEGQLSLLTEQITSDSYTTCKDTRVANVIILSGVDYYNIKMAVVSIFWRMSIAKHRLFSAYSLGPYEEEFRVILQSDALPASNEFPILISKGLLNGKFHSGILFPVGRGRYANDLIMQSIILNGIVFDCIMTNTRTIPSEIQNFALHSSGRVLIASRPYEELGMNVGDFSSRMKNEDVKSFFAKHN